MNAGSGRAIDVKRVDRRTIEGSTPGDHRAPSKDVAKASLTQAAEGQGGPRSAQGNSRTGEPIPQAKAGVLATNMPTAAIPKLTMATDWRFSPRASSRGRPREMPPARHSLTPLLPFRRQAILWPHSLKQHKHSAW